MVNLTADNPEHAGRWLAIQGHLCRFGSFDQVMDHFLVRIRTEYAAKFICIRWLLPPANTVTGLVAPEPMSL